MRKLLTSSLIILLAITCRAQTPAADGIKPVGIIKNLTDSALLDVVQRQTFRYFWDFGHPVSGLARERSNTSFNYGGEVVTTGGSGFGIMAMIVATDRHWITRDQADDRMLKILRFLDKADSFHGVFPHWMNGETGKVIPFGRKDDGADLVETSYLMEGLLCARQYYNADNDKEGEIRGRIESLWSDVEWDWFTRDGRDNLYWHWSSNNGWAMNFPIRGFNECMIVYILAESATRYPVPASLYSRGWAQSDFFKTAKPFMALNCLWVLITAAPYSSRNTHLWGLIRRV